MRGTLSKLRSHLADPVQYDLLLSDESIPLNTFIGQNISIRYTGSIFCQHCGRKTKKSYSQGHCFPCARKLAACDICIMRPEQCHYHLGTCREPEWGESHCMQPHIVYLANSSGLKVGITRRTNVPYRWIDQGAIQAIPLLQVTTRYQSGLIETKISQHISDKTNWRVLIKKDAQEIDLMAKKGEILTLVSNDIKGIQDHFGADSVSALEDEKVTRIHYPIQDYPEKSLSLSLDKTPEITAKLLGIKGQYCLFDIGVMNIRKHTGYEVVFDT